VLAATVLTGCTTARSDLGSPVGPCFQALPAATKAIGGHGHLLGVQPFTVGTLARQAPHLFRDLSTAQPSGQRICVLAFSGHFEAHSVQRARGRSTGRLAVVVTTTSGSRLLGTVIFTNPPFHLGPQKLG